MSAEREQKLRLGGMALGNGLLVHGPTHWAAAVRLRDGSIASASGRKPRLRGRLADAPGARGIARLGEALAVVPLAKRALPGARLPLQSKTVLVAAGTTALASSLVRRRINGPAAEAALLALSIAPALVALRSGDLAAYHGVEHKAIAAYEQDADDAADAAKEHDRCGSHLMTPLLAANYAGMLALRRLVASPSAAARLGVQLASIAAAVEVFAWCERNRDSALARALRVPGHELQRLIGTREPSEEQLAVGRAALAEILRVERAAQLERAAI